MEISTLKEELVEADVLCVGGGIAGIMAAIRASQLGAKVVVVEKGNALYSGKGRAGDDHFTCYIPDVHGPDIRARLNSPRDKFLQSSAVVLAFLENSFDIVKLWESWGIPMKYQGRWEFAGQTFPGGIPSALKYEGRMQKRILVDKALKEGAKIVNRVMALDLFRGDDGIVGAIGVHTREDKIMVFHAKSVILGTGFVDRLYPPLVPGWLGSLLGGFTLTGDGRVMAFKAGGELIGVETLRRHAGARYFCKEGQGTWIGVLRDPQDKPIGPFVTKPDRKYGDFTAMANSQILEDYLKSGRGPVYMDCRGISDDDYEYMMHWLTNEGNVALINHMKQEGIDVRRNPVEFGTYHPLTQAAIKINEKAETSLNGLYAGGDETMGSIGVAATYGWIAGENAAKYAKEKAFDNIEEHRDEIERRKSLIHGIRNQMAGPDWRETNVALQQIMQDYAGLVRSETLLSAGLTYLRRLKEKANTTMMARNQWELTRCLETLNLLDLGELIFLAANERKETRGLHKRTDYPLTNPKLNDILLSMKMVKGEPVIEWRKME